MTRRNMLIMMGVVMASLFCYARVDRNPYGRYLSQALAEIDDKALERVPQAELFDGAMEGMVEQLKQRGDEYSSYITPKDSKELEESLRQEIVGIGVRIMLEGEDERLIVVNPPEYGSPAHKVGIRARDQILEVDGVSVVGMKTGEVAERIRGEVGTMVRLTILHQGDEKPVEVAIERATIHFPSVLGDRPLADGSWEFRLEEDPRIGYLRIISFGEKTVGELSAVLQKIKRQDMEALVIDLRDNTGGLLEAAVETCDMFLPAGKPIVSIKGRGSRLVEEYRSSGDAAYRDWPLAVLVNNYSASASEIVAACLQDQDRAVVIGQRTWGKGTVQHLIPLGASNSILKLTAASYWRPSGKNIHRHKDAEDKDAWGVSPDEGFVVELDEKEAARWRDARLRRHIIGPADEVPADDQGPESPDAKRQAPEEPAKPGADEEPSADKPAEADQTVKENSDQATEDAEGAADSADEAAADDEPFVDRQLLRAIEALQKQLKQRVSRPQAA